MLVWCGELDCLREQQVPQDTHWAWVGVAFSCRWATTSLEFLVLASLQVSWAPSMVGWLAKACMLAGRYHQAVAQAVHCSAFLCSRYIGLPEG